MAETYSTMIPLGMKAPDFRLWDTVSSQYYSLQDLKSTKATVIMFLCNHCPYVKHIQLKLAEIAQSYAQKGIQFIGICSNDAIAYPADSPEKMKLNAIEYRYTFPYLYDETQEVAKAYQAVCTPEFYVFDDNLKCVYRGRFDASTPSNKYPITGNELTQALDSLLMNQPISTDQKASVGCNIKWKKA